MSVKGLPAPSAGAKQIALMCSAIVSDVAALLNVPGTNTFHQFISALIDRRCNRSQTILLEALQSGEVDILSDAQAEFAIPVAFRFFQAARDGEAAHNLRIMADIIAGRIKANKLDPTDFLRIARQLEGLSISDLAALVAVYEVDDLFRTRIEGEGDWREKKLVSRIIPHFFKDKVELGASLALLAGRGLIVPDHQTTLDAALQAYLCTPSLDEIVSLAKNQLERSSTSDVG